VLSDRCTGCSCRKHPATCRELEISWTVMSFSSVPLRVLDASCHTNITQRLVIRELAEATHRSERLFSWYTVACSARSCSARCSSTGRSTVRPASATGAALEIKREKLLQKDWLFCCVKSTKHPD